MGAGGGAPRCSAAGVPRRSVKLGGMLLLQGRKVRGEGKEVGSHPMVSAAFSFPASQLQQPEGIQGAWSAVYLVGSNLTPFVAALSRNMPLCHGGGGTVRSSTW